MADENPELKLFESYHKEATHLNKITRGVDDHISKSQSGLFDAMHAYFKAKRNDKGRIDFKEEKEGLKGGSELFTEGAKAFYSKYIAVTPDEKLMQDILKNDRHNFYLEGMLEKQIGIGRDGFAKMIGKEKTITAEQMLAYTGQLFGAAKKHEHAYVSDRSKQKFADDPKTFNKYLRMVLADNAKSPNVAKALETLEEKAEISSAHLFDPKMKDVFDPDANHKIWATIAGAIGNEYDFKKKLEELAKKAA